MAASPVIFELSAELSYASVDGKGAEGLSGELVVFVWNAAAALTLLVAPSADGAEAVNVLTPAVFLLCGLSLGCVTESYGRRDAEGS